MFRLTFLCSAVLLLLAGCSSDATPTRNNDFTPLTSIAIVAEASPIAARTSTRLTVTGNYSGEFSRDVTTQADWSSSNSEVAVVTVVGNQTRVTTKNQGRATLTATVGGVSNIFELEVTGETISAMTITPAAPVVPQGLDQQFTVSGTFSDGTTQDLTFDAAWASSDPNVATVSDPASKGLAHAVASQGTTTISATFVDVKGNNGVATAAMTVTEPALQSITVTPADPQLSANPTLLSQTVNIFKALGAYSNHSTANITAQAAWGSSRSEIATITSGSKVKTLTPGTTAITAALGGVSGASSVKVTGGFLTGIAPLPANLNLIKGVGQLVTARGSFNNGSSRDITGAVDWSVDAAVADVTSPRANLTEINPQRVTVAPTLLRAKSGLYEVTSNLTVTDLQPQISITPARLDLVAGTSGRFTATANFSGGISLDVTAGVVWSSESATASVDNGIIDGGVVRGVADSGGQVKISAKYGSLPAQSVWVTVSGGAATVLEIIGSQTVHVGEEVNFTAMATYSGGKRDVTRDVTWSVDKPDIAVMTNNPAQPGQVVGVDSGSATLKAVFSGITQTRILTIQ